MRGVLLGLVGDLGQLDTFGPPLGAKVHRLKLSSVIPAGQDTLKYLLVTYRDGSRHATTRSTTFKQRVEFVQRTAA